MDDVFWDVEMIPLPCFMLLFRCNYFMIMMIYYYFGLMMK